MSNNFNKNIVPLLILVGFSTVVILTLWLICPENADGIDVKGILFTGFIVGIPILTLGVMIFSWLDDSTTILEMIDGVAHTEDDIWSNRIGSLFAFFLVSVLIGMFVWMAFQPHAWDKIPEPSRHYDSQQFEQDIQHLREQDQQIRKRNNDPRQFLYDDKGNRR